MKKLIVALFLSVSCVAAAYGRPPAPVMRAPAPHHPPVMRAAPPPHHHRHHRSTGAFVTGAVLGGLVGSVIAPPPPPVVVPVRVWVPGCWVNELDYWGRPVTRFIPGHWEYR